MIRHHPSSLTLEQFVNAALSPSFSLMVAAHCDFCEKCRNRVDKISENKAHEIEDQSFDRFSREDLSNMFDNIVASDCVDGFDRSAQPVEQFPRELKIDGKSFTIPRSLRRFVNKELVWNRHLGKLSHANVTVGGENLAQFIFMGTGGGVPEHTHKGNEYTLVLDGQFDDGISDYDSGDLIVMGSQDKHSPNVASGEGCLVFSIIDKPLQFTSGWARLINPLSQLYFHATTHRP